MSPPAFIRVLVLALALAVPLGGAATPRGGAVTPPSRLLEVASSSAKKRPRPKRVALGVRAARLALRKVGTPYLWGGAGPDGFDCSGFTGWVYGRLGVSLPHNAAAQFAVGRPVRRSRLRVGDLVFFRGLGHVGLYLGKGRMVHAPQSGRRVEVVRLAGHYESRFVGARRVAT